jgi:hypothetical protein
MPSDVLPGPVMDYWDVRFTGSGGEVEELDSLLALDDGRYYMVILFLSGGSFYTKVVGEIGLRNINLKK